MLHSRKKLSVLRSLLIGVTSLLMLVACTTDGVNAGDGETTADPQVPLPGFEINAEVRIVRSNNADATEKRAATLIADAIKENLGIEVRITTDYYSYSGSEIQIGADNKRDEISAFTDALYLDGYGWRVVSASKVVVAGLDSQDTFLAARDFVETMLSGTETELKVGAEFLKNEKPTGGDMYTLNGHDLGGFAVVAADVNSAAAKSLVNDLNKNLGLSLELVSADRFKRGDAICIDIRDFNNYGGYRYVIESEESDGDCRIYLDGGTEKLAEKAIAMLLDRYISLDGSATEFTVPEKVYGYHWIGGENASRFWLESDEVTEVADGVNYYRRTYARTDGKLVEAYAVTVTPDSPAKATIWAAPQGTTKTVLAQAKEIEAAGRDVIAAVNAGFFKLASKELTTWGLQVIDGVVYTEPNPDYPQRADSWFGVTKDGEYVIAGSEEYKNTYAGKLAYAAGGGYRVIIDGKVTSPKSAEDATGPCTAVGLTADGTLAIVVVDGRSEASAGANLPDLVQLFLDLDLEFTDVLNFDGGGSTTLVMEGENGDPAVINVPSDKNLRPVADILAVVIPNE